MKRRQGDWWARAVLDGSCGLRRRTGEPYMPLEEEHDGRYQMRDSRCVRRELWLCCTGRESPSCSWKRGAVWRVGWRAPTVTEGSLQLCCTGGESLVRRRVRSVTPTTDGGLTHCDRKEPRLCFTRRESPVRHWIGKEIRGAVWRIRCRAPMQPKGASGSAAPGGSESLVRCRVRSIAQTTEGGLTRRVKGAVGLQHRKGSPVRCWISKETRLMEGLSLRPKGACGSAAPEGRVPLAAEYEAPSDKSSDFWKNLSNFPNVASTVLRARDLELHLSLCLLWSVRAAHVHTVLPRTNHLPASPFFEIKLFNLTVFSSFLCFFFFFFFLLMHLYYSLSQSFSSFQFLKSSKIAYWAMSERLYVIVLTRTQQ